jgi:hypothetical protein
MGARSLLRSALIVCILLNVGFAAKEEDEPKIDDSHITVLTTKNFDEVVKPVKHALVSRI